MRCLRWEPTAAEQTLRLPQQLSVLHPSRVSVTQSLWVPRQEMSSGRLLSPAHTVPPCAPGGPPHSGRCCLQCQLTPLSTTSSSRRAGCQVTGATHSCVSPLLFFPVLILFVFCCSFWDRVCTWSRLPLILRSSHLSLQSAWICRMCVPPQPHRR